MAEIKVTKTKDGILLSGSIPPEMASASSLEIIQLRDGSFLITPRAQKGGSLSEKEKDLVRKLLSIRFEKRIPAQVDRTLSAEEKELLESLLRRKMVHILHGGKYAKEGVYNVSEFAFSSVREPPHAAAPPALPQKQLPANSPEHLEKFGWMVLESEHEARNFSNAFPEKVRSGAVKGMRAFDRKYYFVTPRFVELWGKKALSALGKGAKSAEELSGEVGLSPDGCLCLLLHLCEEGDALEKQKGKFARA